MKKISLMLMALLGTSLYGFAGEQQADFRNLENQSRMVIVTADDTLATVQNKIRESGLLGEGNENREFRILQVAQGNHQHLSAENFNHWRESLPVMAVSGFVVLAPLAQAAQPAQGHHPQQENPQQQAQEFAPA